MTDVSVNDLANPATRPHRERFRRLSEVVVDCETRCVLRDGQATRLEPRVFALLLYFMDNAGRAISRRELGERVWNGVHVVDEAIQRAVSVLRQALGDTPKQGLYIQTTETGAYRLVSAITALPSENTFVPADWRRLAIAVAIGALLGATAMTWFGDDSNIAPRAERSADAGPPGEAPVASRE